MCTICITLSHKLSDGGIDVLFGIILSDKTSEQQALYSGQFLLQCIWFSYSEQRVDISVLSSYTLDTEEHEHKGM